MNQTRNNQAADGRPADLLMDSIISEIITRHCPQRMLVISANPSSLPETGHARNTFVARIETAGKTGLASLNCTSGSLPFEDGSFNLMILHHVLADGPQPELDEAQRVLTGNGQLLVIGRSRFGMHPTAGGTELPVFNIRTLCNELKRHTFQVRQCEGIGFRGRALHLKSAWHQVALPFSDLVLVRGRQTRHNPVVTPLKFSQPQMAGVRSATLEGLSREAV